MNNPKIDKQAFEDLKEAILWYEKQQENLGLRLFQEVKKTIEFIAQNPKHYRKQAKYFRQVKVGVFPYVIIYEHMDETVIVYRVFHTSRNPKYKYRVNK